jgi:Arc/MetJ family transcription regulator
MRTNIVIDDKLLDEAFDAASLQITLRVHEKISSQF